MHRNIQTPAARANDPGTSHAAADAMTRSGERQRQQRVVETLVRSWPGSTSAELVAYGRDDAVRLRDSGIPGQFVQWLPKVSG